jgi:hypothetical protein
MVLFCTVVSVLLVASYLAFWGLLAHEIPSQLNHQLQETGRLLIAPRSPRLEILNVSISLENFSNCWMRTGMSFSNRAICPLSST